MARKNRETGSQGFGFCFIATDWSIAQQIDLTSFFYQWLWWWRGNLLDRYTSFFGKCLPVFDILLRSGRFRPCSG